MVFMKNLQLVIEKELLDYIIPLAKEEFLQLEKNILAHGCREPLVVWRKSRNKLVLVDGHNRYRICLSYGLPYKVKENVFRDMEEAKAWMINNQLGRRNLTRDQISYYRGLNYLSMKKNHGGYENVKSKGQKDLSTSGVLAKKFRVSDSTIKRDAQYAHGLDVIGRSNPELKMKILQSESKARKSDIIMFAMSGFSTLEIESEEDLHKKAIWLRDKHLPKERNADAHRGSKILSYPDMALLTRAQWGKEIKVQIVRAIDRAMRLKTASSVAELKSLFRIIVKLLNA
jgi:hypothetical protein